MGRFCAACILVPACPPGPPGVEEEGEQTDRHSRRRYSVGGQHRHSECWQPVVGVGHNRNHSNWVVDYRGRSLQEGNEVGTERRGSHPVLQHCPWGRLW